MSYLWQLSDPSEQARRVQAQELARAPKITRRADGVIEIYIPAIHKLLDPHNVCICPDCILIKTEA